MDIPHSFHEKLINCFGIQGEKWLELLEVRTNEIAKKWDLTLGDPVANLSYNYVNNVTDKNNEPYILKMGLPGFDFQNEVRTVELYDGVGCVRVIQADTENGAMLLEKLQPGQMLSDMENEREVIQTFCDVWQAIRRPLPETGEFPTITNWATAFGRYRSMYPANDGPIPNEHIEMAEAYIKEIMQTSTDIQLLHGDLHHENILYSTERGWLAIDPKGVGGDAHFDLVSFMINHLLNKPNPRELLKLRVELICDQLKLNREKLLKAAVGLATLYACWGVEDKDPEWKNTHQCVLWFDELLNA
ncbi:aminoglycoside phosphotransferase family protein [Sporosarcina highlanderae]|uniref:Aminoglycoside phosphotransferase family protein n=1 Tax=Sporosarcina highlanderae TaxID=3035916 RepID=A0ABT8JUK2_9BACL|nr:aminoglycoside phosphotransferase family protein [Sporosarcina highlanderae]MDN4607859.1 aminoglycoside phosphotransferase family protein [Sporosarcina highlanderae]